MLPNSNAVASASNQLGKAHKLEIVRTRDYCEQPHPGGYRALHLWCRRDGFKVEIQLRTVNQQAWAELVEEIDSTVGTDIKHEDAPDVLLRYFRELGYYYALLDENVAKSDIDTSTLFEATGDLRRWLTREAKP